MSGNTESLKRRELKEIANRVNNSGIEKALKHKDFTFIFDYMKEKGVDRIVLNTTLTSPEMPIMKYRFDDDTLVISSVFENSGVDNSNIIISSEKVIVSFLDNKIVDYNNKRGTKRILLNYINQLKQIDKVFKHIEKERKKKKKKIKY